MGSDTIKTTITKSDDLIRSLLGDGEGQETFDGHPRPDDGRNVLPTWRTLAVDARGLDQTSALCGKRSVTAPPHPFQRGVPSKTQSYDDTIDLKNQIYPWITKVGCSLGGPPSFREDLRVPTRRIHQGVSESNTCTGTEEHCSSVPLPPFWGVTGQSGTTPHHAGDQKTGKVEVRQPHCPVPKIWKTGAGPVRSQQKSTNLLRSHRLSSRGVMFGKLRVEDVLRRYHAARNLFERFRGFLELISRFEFEFCRRKLYIFERFEFLVCSCECAVACLCPRNSISNVVASVTIDANIYIYIYLYI